MNRTELRTKIIEWSHRSDLAGQLDTFIDNVTARLNNRLGLALTMPGQAGENIISRDYPNIYLMGSLREMAIYTADRDAAFQYDSFYEKEVSNLNINADSEGFTDSVAVLSEAEQELVNAP